MIEFEAKSQLAFPLRGARACTLICLCFINLIGGMEDSKKALFYPENKENCEPTNPQDKTFTNNFGCSVAEWRKEILNGAIELGARSRTFAQSFKRSGLNSDDTKTLMAKLHLKEGSQWRAFAPSAGIAFDSNAASTTLIDQNSFAKLVIARGHTIAVLHLDHHLWLFDSKATLFSSSLKVYSDDERETFVKDLEEKYHLSTAPQVEVSSVEKIAETPSEAPIFPKMNPALEKLSLSVSAPDSHDTATKNTTTEATAPPGDSASENNPSP